jgi:hypothetical protein
MKENKKIKIIGTIIGIVLFVILIAGFTFAWFTWESSRINISGNTACFNINYTEGNLVTDDMLLVDANKLISNNKITIKRGMAVTNLSASKDPKCTKVKAIPLFIVILLLDINLLASTSSISSVTKLPSV